MSKKIVSQSISRKSETSFSKQKKFFGIFLLIFLCLAVFAQVVTFKFVNYDDSVYVYENPHIQNGLTWEGIRWSFTADLLFDSPNADYWQPMTFLSRMLDMEFWGLNSGGHHFTNLLIHILNVILVFLIFFKMTESFWPSVGIAALFAVHPLQVDAVAWVTARKDVLSIFFGLVSFWNYCEYVQQKKRSKYVASILFFLLSLLSKPALISFPILLLLLDHWPLKRFQSFSEFFKKRKELVSEKIPFAILSLCSAATLLLAFKNSKIIQLGVEKINDFHAPVFYIKYFWKTVYPLHLSVISTWKPYPLNLTVIICVLLLILVSLLAILLRRRLPYLLTGWFWFLFALIPAVTVEISSRYMYVPILGLLMILIWGAMDFCTARRIEMRKLAGLVAATVFFLAFWSFKQTMHWKNDETLFGNIIPEMGQNSVIENSLGTALLNAGNLQEAEEHLRKSIALDPLNAFAYGNLGLIRQRMGKPEQAEIFYRKAIELNPELIDPYNNLALVLAVQEKNQEAVNVLSGVLRIAPENSFTHAYLGEILLKMKRMDLASVHLQKALYFNPKDAVTLNSMGVLLTRQGHYQEAVRFFQKALRLSPENASIAENIRNIRTAIEQNKIKS